MSRQTLVGLCLALLLGGCDCGCNPTVPHASERPPVAEPPGPPRVAASLALDRSVGVPVVGMRHWISVSVVNQWAEPMSSEQATITTSDSAVVKLESYVSGGRRQAFLDLVAPGTAIVTARLGSLTDTLVVEVHAVAPVSTALTVDSFRVIEYVPTCWWSCPDRLAYRPLLYLREPTGVGHADVVWVEFTAPDGEEMKCGDDTVRYGPAQAGLLNPMTDRISGYGDMSFGRTVGNPLPDGAIVARVLVRDATGAYGWLPEATAEVERITANPELPPDATAGTIRFDCFRSRQSGS